MKMQKIKLFSILTLLCSVQAEAKSVAIGTKAYVKQETKAAAKYLKEAYVVDLNAAAKDLNARWSMSNGGKGRVSVAPGFLSDALEAHSKKNCPDKKKRCGTTCENKPALAMVAQEKLSLDAISGKNKLRDQLTRPGCPKKWGAFSGLWDASTRAVDQFNSSIKGDKKSMAKRRKMFKQTMQALKSSFAKLNVGYDKFLEAQAKRSEFSHKASTQVAFSQETLRTSAFFQKALKKNLSEISQLLVRADAIVMPKPYTI